MPGFDRGYPGHRVRGGDEEGCLHPDEPLHAEEGPAPAALVGERRSADLPRRARSPGSCERCKNVFHQRFVLTRGVRSRRTLNYRFNSSILIIG